MTTESGWPLVPLAQLMKSTSREARVEQDKEYALLGARWYAKGLYTKAVKAGNDIKASKLYRVQAGDFVYNRLFAWKGSFAVASPENDGCFVSNEFPCFAVDSERLIPELLWFYFTREESWNRAFGLSTGATPSSRNRLKEASLLAMTIPLPPMEEQRKLVAKINRLVGCIEEVAKTRRVIQDEARAILRSTFARAIVQAPKRRFADVAPLIRRRVEVIAEGTYPELGIRSFGKGTFHKPSLDSIEVGTKKLYRIDAGDLVFNNVFAWEGAIAVAQPEDSGRVGSHRFITCTPLAGVAIAEFLCFFFLTPEGLEMIGRASPGGAGRNRTLGLEKLAQVEVPVPAIDQQIRFGRLLQNVNQMLALQQAASAKLNYLLPSILDRAFKGAL